MYNCSHTPVHTHTHTHTHTHIQIRTHRHTDTRLHLNKFAICKNGKEINGPNHCAIIETCSQPLRSECAILFTSLGKNFKSADIERHISTLCLFLSLSLSLCLSLSVSLSPSVFLSLSLSLSLSLCFSLSLSLSLFFSVSFSLGLIRNYLW